MGLLQRIFGKIPDQRRTGMVDAEAEAMKIVRAYGAAMEKKTTRYGDLSSLPYPKDTIKSALVDLLRRTKDAMELDQLMTGYLLLADWQEGAATVNFASLQSPANLTTEQVRQSAQRFLSSGVYEMTTKVVTEMQQLAAELEAQGLWPGASAKVEAEYRRLMAELKAQGLASGEPR